MEISVPLSLIALHFLFDWKFQSNWMAMNKSRQTEWIGVKALLIHSFIATCYTLLWGWKFWLANWALHYIVDAVTSQFTKKFWFIKFCPGLNYVLKDLPNEDLVVVEPQFEKRHNFFVTIGFDQLLHYTCLALTLRWLVG